MNEKFANVPVEVDTKVLSRTPITFGSYEAIHEKWKWVLEGVSAESIILLEADISAVSDDELKQKLRDSGLMKPDSQITIARERVGFTFLNFNFVVGSPPGEWEPETF